MLKRIFIGLMCIGTIGAAPIASAEEAQNTGLSIELNAAAPAGNACLLSFVLESTLETEIEALVAETVLFSKEGQVSLLTLFDFGTLPPARKRVRQFQIPDTPCDALGLVLINGFESCQINGAASKDCASGLRLSSRLPIPLEG